MNCNMLAAGLIGYRLNKENNKEMMNCFAIQSFEADCRNNGSQYNISAATKNAGRKGGHRENKKNFLKP